MNSKLHRTPWIFINSVFLINLSIHIPVGCKLSSDKWLSRPFPDSCSYQWFYGRNHNHIVIPGTSRLAFHFNPKSSPVNLTPWPFCIFPARVQLPCKFASLMCYTFDLFFSLSLFSLAAGMIFQITSPLPGEITKIDILFAQLHVFTYRALYKVPFEATLLANWNILFAFIAY